MNDRDESVEPRAAGEAGSRSSVVPSSDKGSTAQGSSRRWILGRLGLGSDADGSVRARTIRGSVISLVSSGGTHAMTLASNVVLTRLLPPSAFGVMALVRMVLQGLKMFSDVGIGPSIIHHARGEERAFQNTAWTIQVVRGTCLWLGASVLAWPVAQAYGVPELMFLLPVGSFASAIAGFNSPVTFTLQRKLRYGWQAWTTLATNVAGMSVSILFAWLTGSVWALVIGWLASATCMLVLSHTTVPQPRVAFTWDRDAARDLLGFGRWVFISTMLTYLAGQADRLVLGRLLTLDVLGVYALALTVASLPGTVVQSLASAVMLPVLAIRARESRSTLDAVVIRTRSVILPGGLCATLAVVTLAPVLFEFVYDERYRGAAWMCQAMSLPAWFRLLESSADRAVMAVGDARSLAVSNLIELAVTVSASLTGFAVFGLGGFILGMAVGAAAAHAVVLAALRRHGVSVLAQDLRYTAGALALGGAAAVAPDALQAVVEGVGRLPALLATVAVFVVPVAIWALRGLVREVSRR